jgi:hypothetical protein
MTKEELLKKIKTRYGIKRMLNIPATNLYLDNIHYFVLRNSVEAVVLPDTGELEYLGLKVYEVCVEKDHIVVA